ncbi:hypothetical protein [Schleiferia thermophila]|uniref:hypothetical protein n=1 Tax=Schleiferia thermophila TaxID=884107 RepID=UPI003EF00502
MKRTWKVHWIICAILPVLSVFGQNLNPRYHEVKRIFVYGDTLLLPSDVYAPSLVLRSNGVAADSCFKSSGQYAVFYFVCDSGEVEISYYTYPPDYLSLSQGLDRKLIQPKGAKRSDVQAMTLKTQNTGGLFDSDLAGISRTGAISRFVRAGSNQSPVLNSTLDLQLSGLLRDSTRIRASITDNRVPVQADGYSQQLREIDRIFIEISHPKRGKVTAGDYQIQNLGHYFLNFDRRITGLGLETTADISETMKVRASANAAASRGIFARNTFMGQEGNQGPYKLFGNNNELFIIIISGSERVYLDGMLLTRGQEYDYVMDYNAGEITFTALRPITRERRIVVEFQYTSLLYLRTIAYGELALESEKFQIELVHYDETDSRTQTLFQDLTEAEKQIIAQAGADFGRMRIPSAVQVEYSPDEVLYEKILQPGFGEIFVFSRDSTKGLYRVQFTFVGQGNGNYIPSNNTVNGRVFEWIPPENGRPQGSYEPIRQLLPPQSLSVSSARAAYNGGKFGTLELQSAFSRLNLNRFASGVASQEGFATRLTYGIDRKLGASRLQIGGFSDVMTADFRTVERVRQVEFQRDWSIADTALRGTQLLAGVHLRLTRDTLLNVFNEVSLLRQGDDFRLKYSGELHVNNQYVAINSRFSALKIQGPVLDGTFLRQLGDWSWKAGQRSSIGVRTDVESNLRSDTQQWIDGSYNFFQAEPYWRIYGNRGRNFELFALLRTDDTVYTGGIQRAAVSRGGGIKADWKFGKNADLGASVLYRHIRYDPITGQQDFAAYTGRVRLQQRWMKNALISNTLLETGTGTEPLRVFSYIEVPAGTGTHTWIDYNGNGIKELDEFEPARFPAEARFIRIFAPSSEFTRVEVSKISQSLLFNPVNMGQRWSGFRKFLTRFSLQSTLQTDNRRQLIRAVNTPVHLPGSGPDSLTLGSLILVRQTLFFDRTRSKFGWDANYLFNRSANLLAFGVEEVRSVEYPLNIRYKIIPPLLARLKLNYVNRETRSMNFVSRNFSFDEYLASPRIEFQPGEKYRTILSYEYSSKNSASALLSSHRLISEQYLASASRFVTTATIQYVVNSFTGDANSPLGFAMLEGLQPGQNFIVTLLAQRNLVNGLQLSLTYEGRLGSGLGILHSGVFQVKAFF